MTSSSQLLRSPASILAACIIEELAKMSLPSDGGDWPLYISSMPDGDDVESDCGAIYDTTGVMDGRQMDGYVPVHNGIQVRIRSKDYENGYAKIEDIAISLDGVNNVSIEIGDDEYEIQNVRRTSAIVSLGAEEGTKRRYLFTVNFLTTIKNLNA